MENEPRYRGKRGHQGGVEAQKKGGEKGGKGNGKEKFGRKKIKGGKGLSRRGRENEAGAFEQSSASTRNTGWEGRNPTTADFDPGGRKGTRKEGQGS